MYVFINKERIYMFMDVGGLFLTSKQLNAFLDSS